MRILSAIILSLALLSGGAHMASAEGHAPSPAGADTAVNENASVQLIHSMMALDYRSMTVSQFNEDIQALCADAGTTVFQVISDVYDHFSVYDEDGVFVDTIFPDRELESFVQTTLEYSAQEIFQEPVHTGSIMYMTMPGVTATELHGKKEEMPREEWNRFFEENIGDISIFPVLTYSITEAISDPETLLIAERDDRLNDTQASIANFFLGMDPEDALEETLWDRIESEFDSISAEHSDDKITISCQIQGLERDMEMK